MLAHNGRHYWASWAEYSNAPESTLVAMRVDSAGATLDGPASTGAFLIGPNYYFFGEKNQVRVAANNAGKVLAVFRTFDERPNARQMRIRARFLEDTPAEIEGGIGYPETQPEAGNPPDAGDASIEPDASTGGTAGSAGTDSGAGGSAGDGSSDDSSGGASGTAGTAGAAGAGGTAGASGASGDAGSTGAGNVPGTGGASPAPNDAGSRAGSSGSELRRPPKRTAVAAAAPRTERGTPVSRSHCCSRRSLGGLVGSESAHDLASDDALEELDSPTIWGRCEPGRTTRHPTSTRATLFAALIGSLAAVTCGGRSNLAATRGRSGATSGTEGRLARLGAAAVQWVPALRWVPAVWWVQAVQRARAELPVQRRRQQRCPPDPDCEGGECSNGVCKPVKIAMPKDHLRGVRARARRQLRVLGTADYARVQDGRHAGAALIRRAGQRLGHCGGR